MPGLGPKVTFQAPQACERCRVVWADGHGPDSVPDDAELPEKLAGPTYGPS